MSVLSRLTPSKAVLAGLTILVAMRMKSGRSRLRLLLSVLAGCVVYSKGAQPVSEGANPPGSPKALPWLGHLYLFPKLRDNIHRFSLELAMQTNFKSLMLSLPDGLRIVYLHDEVDRKYILKDNFPNYPKNYNDSFGFDKVFTEIMGSGIFAVDGDQWKTHRKVAASLFTGNIIGITMARVFAEHAEQLKDALLNFADEDKEFDIQLLLQCLVFDAFCFIAFGESRNSFQLALKGEKEDFQVCFDYVQIASAQRGSAPPAWREFAKYFRLGAEAHLADSVEKMDAVVYDIIKRRKQAMVDTPEKFDNVTDILGLYLDFSKRKNRPEITDDTYLRDVILNFMIAGRDTTSYVLTNIFSLIAEHPEVDAKVMDELSQRMRQGPLHYSQNEVKHFPLGDAVFNEALRMYPSVGVDGRWCKEEEVLPSGLRVPAGCQVLLPLYAIGRNPKYNSDPDSFIPERWLKEVDGKMQCKRIDEYKNPFFWGGYRICLGKDMARMEAKVIMGIVLQSIKFTMARPREDAFVPGPVMFYRNGMFLRAQRRTQT